MTLLPILATALFAGASTALLGVYLLGMRIPFTAILSSHAAMAGMVAAQLLGLPPLPMGIAVAAVATAFLARLDSHSLGMESNAGLSALFTFFMGLAFLGIGLSKGPKENMLGLLWGSLVFATETDAILAAGMSVLLIVFLLVFSREMKAILFSRTLARASGIRVTLVLTIFLVLSGVILTVNLRTVGGLMIYSLVSNPAATAFQLCRRLRSVLFLTPAVGMLSALGGFMMAYFFDLPVGACIVLISSAIFGIVTILRSMGGKDTNT